jgi:hypothetical protein
LAAGVKNIATIDTFLYLPDEAVGPGRQDGRWIYPCAEHRRWKGQVKVTIINTFQKIPH